MEGLWKVMGAALLTTVLSLALGKQKDIAVVLTMAACVMAAAVAVGYLKTVVEFLWELEQTAGMGTQILTILLKAVGIGFITQIVAGLCADGGSASLGKTVQLLGTALTLYLSIPIFRQMLDLIREILQ